MLPRHAPLLGSLLAGLVILAAGLAPPATAGKYAVLIDGEGPYAIPSLNTMGFLYRTLVNDYGYAKSDIYVLYYNGAAKDLDADGLNDVDYSATRANIFAVFDTLDINRDVGGDDVVFVYCDDHGSRTDCVLNAPDTGHGELCLYTWKVLRAGEMDSLLTNLEDGDLVDNWPKIMAVFDQCYSGDFVDHLTAYGRRAACSPAGEKQPSNYRYNYGANPRPDAVWPSVNYNAFTYHWICAMHGFDPENVAVDADTNDDGIVTFEEAYQYAQTNDEYAVNKTETPQYWDCSDGWGKRIQLDGTETPLLTATIHRDRAAWGPDHGAGCWGDGGGGGAGIVFDWLALSQGGTTAAGASGMRMVWARVHNTGTLPVTGLMAHFSYGLPSTIASAADASLHTIGSASLGMLAPGDTARIGPVTMPDPGLNDYGQDYWKVFVRLEAPSIPPESGWVEDDLHTGVENYHQATSMAGEPVELRFQIANPQSTTKRMVLQVLRNTLPQGWTVQCTPSLGDTLDLPPGASLPATLRVVPDAVHGPTGVVTIEERLHDPFAGCWAHCMGQDQDSAWVSEGGFVQATGGISFEVTAPYSISAPVGEPEARISLAYPSPTTGGVTLAYTLTVASPVRIAVYDVSGRRLLGRDLGAQGAGVHAFTWNGRSERGDLAPAGVYLLRLELRDRVEEHRVVVVR